ncbi:MAG: GTPase Era [Bacteroidia bacterium]
MHKAAFISIIGKPNAGKSTFINALMGQHFCIVSPKAQTTRHRIKGFITEKDYQLVFSDTPGIIIPKYKMQEAMMEAMKESLEDADLLLLVHDEADNELSTEVLDVINNFKGQKILILNKVDRLNEQQIVEKTEHWKASGHFYGVVPFSSVHPFNKGMLVNFLVELSPEHPAYYPEDEISDRNTRFFLGEFIREKILFFYEKEIPYSVEVKIDNFTEEDNLIRISALIYVERDSQKAILIGKGGLALKKVASEARKDMEKFLDKPVFLDVFVKVKNNWRNSEQELKRFGYKE